MAHPERPESPAGAVPRNETRKEHALIADALTPWRRAAASLVALAAAAAIAGCDDAKGGAKKSDAPRTGVVVQTVAAGPIYETLTLPGNVEAIEDTTLSAEVSGRLVTLNVTEGQVVQVGDLIARIDPATAAAAVNQAAKNVAAARAAVQVAQAGIHEAEATANRARQKKLSIQKLHAGGDATQDELDEVVAQAAIADARVLSAEASLASAEASVLRAEAARQTAQINLQKHTIRSPVAGLVDGLPVDPEELVAPGTTVCRIVRTDRLKVMVDVPERDVRYIQAMKQRYDAARAAGPRAAAGGAAPSIRGDQPLIFFKAAMAGYQRHGVIDWVALVADPMTRTFQTRILLDNRLEAAAGDRPATGPATRPLSRAEVQGDPQVRPGMIATVQFVRRSDPQAVSVPRNAIVQRGGQAVLFLYEPGEQDVKLGTARKYPVKFGLSEPQRTQIIGLEPGARVIVTWDIELSADEQVRVKGWLGPDGQPASAPAAAGAPAAPAAEEPPGRDAAVEASDR
jgi:multidrug efflux pump subunit AcrA (membrane-fusion protein)